MWQKEKFLAGRSLLPEREKKGLSARWGPKKQLCRKLESFFCERCREDTTEECEAAKSCVRTMLGCWNRLGNTKEKKEEKENEKRGGGGTHIL